MPTIADLRAANPWADDVSDLELLNYRAQQTGTTLDDAAKAFGVKYNSKRNALTAGLSAGVDELQGLGYGMLGAGARALGGDGVADWADKNVRINQSEARFNGRPDLENIEDQTLSSMPGYLAYQGAKQLPILGGTIAASAVMPEAVIPAALSRGLAFAPRAIGGGGLSSSALQAAEGYAAKKALTNEAVAAGNQFARIGATSYPMSVGSLYNEAVERGDPTQADALGAFAAGVPYAAGEAVMPAIVNRGLRPGGLGFTGNMATRMGKAAGVDAVGEAGTELFQNELEMGFAGPLSDEEKFSRRLNSAVAGGLVGGMYGAPAGIRKVRPPVVPGEEADLLGGNDYPALPSPNQMPIYADNRGYPGIETVVDDANNVAAAQRSNSDLWAARTAYEQSMDRSGATDLLGDPLSYPVTPYNTDVPEQQNIFGQQAPAEPEPTVVTPNRRQMSLDLEQQTRPEVLYGNQFNPASPVGPNGVQSSNQAGVFTQLPVTDEVRTEPTEHDQAVAAVNGVKTVAQLKAAADTSLAKKLITPEQHVDFMNEVDTNRKLKLADKRGLLTTLITGNQNGNQENVTGRQEGTVQTGQQESIVAPREVGTPQGNEARGGTQAEVGRIGQTQGLLNGTQTQEAVAQQAGQQTAIPVSGPAVTYKRPSKLANATEPQQVAQEAFQTSATQVAPSGTLKVSGTDVTLGAEQQKVVSYVQNAIDNNELENIVDAQGKLRAQDIAKTLGIKNRGSVAMALKGARERIAAAYGVSVDEVKSGLKRLERDRRSVDESTEQKLGLSPEQQTQGVDQDELFSEESSFGVVETLGQSQSNVDDGERVESPDLGKVDPVRQRRDAEALLHRQKFMLDAISSSVAGEAAQDWDDMRADGIPDSSQLDFQTAFDWVASYTEWKTGEITQDELDNEQRQLERQVLGRPARSLRSDEGRNRLAGPGEGRGRTGPFVQATSEAQQNIERTQGRNPEIAGSGQTASAKGANRASSDTGVSQRPAIGRIMENPTQEVLDDIQFFEGKLDKDGRAGATVHAYEVPDALAPFVRAVEKLTKVRVRFVSVDGVSEQADFGGMYSGRNVLFVNVRARKPASFIIGHEFLHYLKNADPQLFDRFTQLAAPLLKLKAANDAATKAGEYYSEYDEQTRKEFGWEEVYADTFGDAWADPQFWQALADQNLTLAQRALRFLKKVVNQIVAVLRNEQHTPVTEALYKNFDAVKNLVLSTTNEFVRRDANPYLDGSVSKASYAATATPEGFFAKAGEFLDDALSNPAGGWSKIKLGWMTLEQIADRVKSDAVKKYTSVMTEMQRFSKHIIYQAAVIDQDWSKLSTNVRANLSSIMRDATRMGFDPEVDTASSDAQRVLKDRFDKTLTKEAKDVYRRVRDHYKAMFNERKQILMDAAANGTLSDRNRAEVEKMFTEVKGPYFPLMRLGKWYAVGTSKELAALQAKVDAGDITPEEQDRYRTLRKDKAHYITKSFDTRGEAKRFSKELSGKYDQSYFNTSKSVIDNAVKSTPDLAKMQDYLTAGMPEGARDDLRNMLAQMYFDMLPDSSPLKRMMKREGVFGEEEDMRKVFAASSISMAHHVSRLKHANKLSEHLVALDKETKRNEQMRHVYNELVERANLSTKVDDTPFADTLNQVSYFAHLGLSPAFILTNMTQVPMITAPWLTARYGFGKTKSALASAYVDASKIIWGTMNKDGWEAEYDWKRLFKEGSNEDRLLSKLLEMNLIDITMEHDLGAVARIGGTGNRDKMNKTIKIASLPVRITEAANRIVTALSSYRLATDKGMTHDEAVEHAAKAISETQLNYSALNAPRYMQSVFGSKALAKMVFQFRKYQQGMVYLIASNAKDAFKGDKEAMKTLFGIMGTTGLMAGATGLPFAGSLFWLATAMGSMFDDDDEPFDARESFRNYLADMLGDDAAQALTKGLPTLMGMDISGNIGMSNIGMPLPYVRDGKKPSDSMKEMLASAAGAPFGTMMEMADGFGELMNGDMAKGATHVIPLKFAKNAIKAAEFYAEGMVDSKGNVILPSERFDGWDLAFRAAGFSTTKETEYYEANSAMQKAKQAASDTRNALLREYAEARIKGDSLTDFQERIADFNSRHPEKGIRIDQSSLIKSVQARKKLADGRTETGLRQDKTMKPYLDRAGFADGQ